MRAVGWSYLSERIGEGMIPSLLFECDVCPDTDRANALGFRVQDCCLRC